MRRFYIPICLASLIVLLPFSAAAVGSSSGNDDPFFALIVVGIALLVFFILNVVVSVVNVKRRNKVLAVFNAIITAGFTLVFGAATLGHFSSALQMFCIACFVLSVFQFTLIFKVFDKQVN